MRELRETAATKAQISSRAMARQLLVFLPNLCVWALAGGVFVTDVTNASRTGLMDLHSLSWHAPTLRYFDIPISALAEIRSNAEVYGRIASGPLAGIPIAGSPQDLHVPTEPVVGHHDHVSALNSS